MTNMLDAALDYARRNWLIFPCGVDKKPLTRNGVLDATTRPDIIKKWWTDHPTANIGLDVGAAGMMVLDYDPGSDYEQCEADNDVPLTFLWAITPRNGTHRYFMLDPNEIVAASVGVIYPHVDVRSFHSYVLLPPSRTKDGYYSWGGEGKPARRSDTMIKNAGKAKERSAQHDTWVIEQDLPEHVLAAGDWLDNEAKVSIEGTGGDNVGYATAAMCKSYGLSEAMTVSMMLELWNPRCLPPWDVEDIERLVRNGYLYNTSPPGNITQAYKEARAKEAFQAVSTGDDDQGITTTASHVRLMSRKAMETIPDPTWLLDGFLIEQSYAMIYGAPSTFKTFLALDMALCIATRYSGNPNWTLAGKAGPVVFAAGEGHASIKKRVRAWEREHWGSKLAQNFLLMDPVPKVFEDIEPYLEAMAKQCPEGVKLIVLDTVGRALQGENENSQDVASAFTRMIERLIKDTGATVLCLHHLGKDAGKGARGSSVFQGDADTMIEVKITTSKSRVVSLVMTKQKDAEAWDDKKFLKLREIILSPATQDCREVKSLVVVQVSKDDKSMQHVLDQDKNRASTDEVITQAALRVLARIPDRNWSSNAFSEAVAMDEVVEIGSVHLRKNVLPRLREASTNLLSNCYDPDTKMWRYFKV